MKHDSASEMRAALARRITQRALDATKQVGLEIVPLGEPERALDHREWEQFRDEEDVLQALRRPSVRALRSRQQYANGFVVFPHCYSRGIQFDRRVIQRLVDKGLVAWVNSVHSAAVLVEVEQSGDVG